LAPTGEAGLAPRLVAGGRTANGDTEVLRQLNQYTGAEPAVLIKSDGRWIRGSTMLKNAQGEPAIGSTLAPGDFTARTLDAGKPYSGLVNRQGRWYAISIKPLLDQAGAVYCGLTVRVDVPDPAQRTLAWINRAPVAGPG